MNVTPEIEAVARAIYEVWHSEHYGEKQEFNLTWDELIKNSAEYQSFARISKLARREAIAAIRALREPTKKMISGYVSAHTSGVDDPEHLYTAMIDAALGGLQK